jgi:outer membrane receptor protein involved in Fe transport
MRWEAIRNAAASGALLVTLACAATATRAQTASQSDSSVNAGGLEEVVVTAQRREESVQRSSLAIAVVSSDALRQAGVTQACYPNSCCRRGHDIQTVRIPRSRRTSGRRL